MSTLGQGSYLGGQTDRAGNRAQYQTSSSLLNAPIAQNVTAKKNAANNPFQNKSQRPISQTLPVHKRPLPTVKDKMMEASGKSTFEREPEKTYVKPPPTSGGDDIASLLQKIQMLPDQKRKELLKELNKQNKDGKLDESGIDILNETIKDFLASPKDR